MTNSEQDPQSAREGEPANEVSGEVYVLPTSLGQERFWELDQMNPGNPT